MNLLMWEIQDINQGPWEVRIHIHESQLHSTLLSEKFPQHHSVKCHFSAAFITRFWHLRHRCAEEIPQMERKINFLSKYILSFINCEELVKLLNNIRLISKPFRILVKKNAGISSRLCSSTSPARSEMRPREDTWIRREAKARPWRHTRPPLVEQNAPLRGGSQRRIKAGRGVRSLHTPSFKHVCQGEFEVRSIWFHLRRDSFQLHVAKCLQSHQGSFIYQVGG